MVLQGPEEPTPTLWEYRREVLKGSEMDAIGRGPDDAHLQTWNGLGLRGWELVSVVREDGDVVGYFKREHRFGVIEKEWERDRAADIEKENKRRTEKESRTDEEGSSAEEQDFGFLNDDAEDDEPLSDYEKKRGF